MTAEGRSRRWRGIIVYLLIVVVVVAAIAALAAYTFLTPLLRDGEAVMLYIDGDDSVDSVYNKVSAATANDKLYGFKILSRYCRYPATIRPGAYSIAAGDRPWTVLRQLRGGLQTPVRLVIPPSRSVESLAASLSQQLMTDSAAIVHALCDSATAAHYGYTVGTLPCMIIPNTYEVYWTLTPSQLLSRCQKEHKTFWSSARQDKARALGLTVSEVYTLASIVDSETAAVDEKPTIARLYYNRLQRGMLLQADPTVLFAKRTLGQQRRVYGKDLTVDSPYNTYLHKGLPPGPIRFASIEGIDAVLNMPVHDYLFMCARADFSGKHAFARTFAEHKENARRYARALDERGIK